MTKSLAYYRARHGVTINAIAPGTIDTTGVREEEFAAAETENYEAAAKYINGSTIVADGAQYMGNWTPMFDPEIY